MKLEPDKKYAIPYVRGNQKAIRIKKAETSDKILYSKFQLNSLYVAMFNLSPNTFKLWAYLNANKDQHCFALSNTDIAEATGMSKGTYDKAVKELIDNGYLRQGLLFPNFKGYIFVEEGADAPLQDEEIQLISKEKKEQSPFAAASSTSFEGLTQAN